MNYIRDEKLYEENFIFDAQIFNAEIDIKNVATIEMLYKQNGFIPANYISLFLNYIIYNARINAIREGESLSTSSFTYRCGRAANFMYELIEKIGIKVEQFNIGDIFKVGKIHQVCIVWIPTIVNGNIALISYILDPTFRQFCLKPEDKIEPFYNIHRLITNPGYYLSLSELSANFANNLITFGYFEATPANLKIYFDAFKQYLNAKENDFFDIPSIKKSEISGEEYLIRIDSCYEKEHIDSDILVQTPIEIMQHGNQVVSYFESQFDLINKDKKI